MRVLTIKNTKGANIMFSIIPYNQLRRNELLRSGNTGYDEFLSLFDDFWGTGIARNQNTIRSIFKVDIAENENDYVIEADLPGIKKEEIDLKIEDNCLIISVEHTDEKTEEEKNYLHKERSVSSMKRRINLTNVKFDEISAKLDNGVLSLTVPKDNPVNQTKKIEIA